MLKNKWILMALLIVSTFSSCGIFHKGCGCPKFGKAKLPASFANGTVC